MQINSIFWNSFVPNSAIFQKSSAEEKEAGVCKAFWFTRNATKSPRTAFCVVNVNKEQKKVQKKLTGSI